MIEESNARLKSKLAPVLEANGISGMSLALALPDGRSQTVSFGTSGVPPIPVDAGTPFSVASSGKHATAVAVLAAAQIGALTLDDAIGDHLDGLPPSWRDRKIIDLLHHTSGLPDYLDGGAAPPETRIEFLERYRSLAPYFDAGDAWCYSNTNYILLGFLVAACAGTTYTDAMREVFDRGRCVEIAAGGPEIPPIDTAAPDPTIYERIEDLSRAREVAGDGDLVLSARGALSWDRALSNHSILSADSTATLLRPRRLSTGRSIPYGCGWFVDRIAGRSCHHHAGHFGGWTAFFYRIPSLEAAVYLMTPVALGNTRAQRYLAQLALEELLPGATPLSIVSADDREPSLTAWTRDAIIRKEGAAPIERLAPELRILVERVPGMRSMLNLWCGQEPDFRFIEGWSEGHQRFRRYRVGYAERVEHVLVGYAPDDRIFWAWPM